MSKAETIRSRSLAKAPQQKSAAKAATPFFNPVIQPKLTINQPNDVYEQEADLVADKVMRMTDYEAVQTQSAPVSIQKKCSACGDEELHRKEDDEQEADVIQLKPIPGLQLQRKCAACEEEEKIQSLQLKPAKNNGLQKCACEQTGDKIDRKEYTFNSTPQATPSVISTLSSAGQPLDSRVRSFMEKRFGYDFKDVRIHNDSVAHQSSAEISALAYTHGNHIAFGKGQYKPETHSGKKLLAHELAHVAQQQGASRFNSVNASSPPTKIQRFGLSTPFWVPISKTKPRAMTGTEIHKEILTDAAAAGLETEAPVPNATRFDWGQNLAGSADLYQPKTMVGLYFKGPTGYHPNDKEYGKPADHPRMRKGKRYMPYFEDGKIQGLGGAAKNISLGELKPADKTVLDKGGEQLQNYYKGFESASKQVNNWMSKNVKGSSKPYVVNPQPLSKSAYKPSPKYQYKPSSPATDRRLVLAEIKETKNEQAKYEISVELNPGQYGLEIRGGLYAAQYQNGLWMYFARPDPGSLSAVLQHPAIASKREQTVLAQQVQDQVIGPLKKGAKQVKGKVDTAVSTSKVKHVQRKPAPKTVKLEDDFSYDNWAKSYDRLAGQFHRGGDVISKDTVNKLEFIDKAYDAEDGLAHTGKSSLPPKSQLKETIKGRSQPMLLPDMFGWLSHWTSKPYRFLGSLRSRFGSTFVTAINYFNKIKESISKKFHSVFTDQAGKKKTAGILIKALARGIKQVIQLIIPKTLSLVFDAIHRGVEKKLQQIFEDSFISKYIDQFKGWWEKLQNYVNKAKEHLDKVQQELLDKFGWISDLIDDVKWIWRIIKAGKTLYTCRKWPPIISCLRNFVGGSGDYDLILCIKAIQKQIADKVLGISWFGELPARLGNILMEKMKNAVPDDLPQFKEVLSEKIPNEKPDTEDIQHECDAKGGGIGLFDLGGAAAGSAQGKDVDAAEKMSDFADEHTKEELEELTKEAEKRGLGNKPFDEEQMKKLEDDIKKSSPDKGDKDKQPQTGGDKQQDKTTRPPAADKQGAQPPDKDMDKPDKNAQQPSTEKTPDKQPGKEPDKPKPPVKAGPGQKPAKPAPKASKPATQKATDEKDGDTRGTIQDRPWMEKDIEIQVSFYDVKRNVGIYSVVSTEGLFTSGWPTILEEICGLEPEMWIHARVDNNHVRPKPFKSPIVSLEVLFNQKPLFTPIVETAEYIGPWHLKYSESIFKPAIGKLTKDGTLKIIVKLDDPTSGVKLVWHHEIKIKILKQKDICCNCYS